MSQVAKSASAFVRAFLAIPALELDDMVVRLFRPLKLACVHGDRWTVYMGISVDVRCPAWRLACRAGICPLAEAGGRLCWGACPDEKSRQAIYIVALLSMFEITHVMFSRLDQSHLVRVAAQGRVLFGFAMIGRRDADRAPPGEVQTEGP
jgi:hypothetical protein